jgi:hypothetical protein
MKIVAIDIGLRNLSLAVFHDGLLTSYGVYDLYEYSPNKRKRTDYPLLVYTFINAETEIFKDVNKVLLECQMKAKFKTIQASFRCFFYDVAENISPLKVRRFFKISTSNYKKNKRASVKYVSQHVFKNKKDKFYSHKKKDDIADAVLIGLYYINAT